MFGLHPELKPLLPMWQAGTFGAVHAVGMPVPNRSHFSAMEQVEDADPGSSARVGWLNRMIGLIQPDEVQEGMQIGSTLLPTSMVGPASAVSARRLVDLKLPGGAKEAEQDRMRTALSTMWGKQASVTGKAARAALQVSVTMAGVAKEAPPANGAEYPTGDLGLALGLSLIHI